MPPFKITIESPDDPTLGRSIKLIKVVRQLIKKLEAETPQPSEVKWTASKVSLTELIYALHASKVFNHGKADIRQIASAVEQAFNLPLDESYYRVFLDIRKRKIDPTVFMNQLKDNLIHHIDEANE